MVQQTPLVSVRVVFKVGPISTFVFLCFGLTNAFCIGNVIYVAESFGKINKKQKQTTFDGNQYEKNFPYTTHFCLLPFYNGGWL
jgi:hypothetical protein